MKCGNGITIGYLRDAVVDKEAGGPAALCCDIFSHEPQIAYTYYSLIYS